MEPLVDPIDVEPNKNRRPLRFEHCDGAASRKSLAGGGLEMAALATSDLEPAGKLLREVLIAMLARPRE